MQPENHRCPECIGGRLREADASHHRADRVPGIVKVEPLIGPLPCLLPAGVASGTGARGRSPPASSHPRDCVGVLGPRPLAKPRDDLSERFRRDP